MLNVQMRILRAGRWVEVSVRGSGRGREDVRVRERGREEGADEAGVEKTDEARESFRWCMCEGDEGEAE